MTGPYQGYVYAYPHKTAYRPLDPPPSLRNVWAGEDRSALFLYLHVPFCEMRCGFCNLFTRTGAAEELTGAYLDALDRQATAVLDALGGVTRGPGGGGVGGVLRDGTACVPGGGAAASGGSGAVSALAGPGTGVAGAPVGAAAGGAADGAAGGATRFAIAAFGGGTPTYLTAPELERLCDIAERFADLRTIPLGVETSPATATADRLAVLAERGATRVSIGVQSFLDEEARAAVRPQQRADVEAALDRIRAAAFPTLNIDLIYGIDGQTPETWLHSLDAALAWEPEEMYLYPLYVRPLTGLGRRARDWDDQRMRLYRIGRDHLLAQGYEQVSMRMFRRPGRDGTVPGGGDAAGGGAAAPAGIEYCCQSDGMIGLGCGARSYTAGLHYSFEYAVGASAVRAIIDSYVRETDFTTARVGFTLDEDERRRRHLIQSLLQASGLDRAFYRKRFGADVTAHFDLEPFADRGWLEDDPDTLRLTPEGLAYSDTIGPALISPRVRALMDSYEAR